ncbi:hypothetical protein AMECASPLE_012232 [Ameca splendens]|uniref:Uncharacterized protein n=1 Tax=Ameca splendens TaxID=208324 RepID=A0ABV0YCU1_9TELE
MTAVLQCLSVFLRDDGREFYNVFLQCSAVWFVRGCTLGNHFYFIFLLFLISTGFRCHGRLHIGSCRVIPEVSQQPGPNALHLEPSILECTIVMDDIESCNKAVCFIFGLTYALHLDYPKCLKNTFEFIQRVMLSLCVGNLKPKLQSLNNTLMQ